MIFFRFFTDKEKEIITHNTAIEKINV